MPQKEDKVLALLRKSRQYTPFQRAVWLACAKIPSGRTMTYGELAHKIGRPRAARAVGSALAKNPFAPIVPCHRVLATGGKPGGYSGPGGIKTKIKMLRQEQLGKTKS
ncbi:MAG TPA: MGMT family protein [Elusimicrobiales bacterium]|nr:MGMT family protein [Elusimicrobiales bacterium]